MHLLRKIALLFVTALLMHSALADSPVGQWITIDDKTGKKRAVLQLSMTGDTLSATVIDGFKQPGDSETCDKCPPPFKNKPILGLRVMWGLKQKGANEWVGGQILDAQTGKIYSIKLTVKGNKITARGFIGISLLGRTQTWIRK